MNLLDHARSGDRNVTRVRGDLLLKARKDQGITMQWVRDHGGPSPAYQSEVEHGSKVEVGSQVLSVWVRLLNVTEPYARGQIPVYYQDPSGSVGLAGHVRARLDASADWPLMDAMVRARRILHLMIQPPTPVPGMVLAHTLNLELQTLDAMLDGRVPVGRETLRALADLSTLGERFFKYGTLESEEDADLFVRFLPVVREAERIGLTPGDLQRWVADQRR